ncbi:hypothetical protein A2T76_04795 [Pseudomonas brenneri]|nr:hypothetical protein A2T76_04795 [Pseudomonas brenneri]
MRQMLTRIPGVTQHREQRVRIQSAVNHDHTCGRISFDLGLRVYAQQYPGNGPGAAPQVMFGMKKRSMWNS